MEFPEFFIPIPGTLSAKKLKNCCSVLNINKIERNIAIFRLFILNIRFVVVLKGIFCSNLIAELVYRLVEPRAKVIIDM